MTRVLIVDDRDDNLNLLRALLESSGYVVDQARHGAEALAIANREPPDLIISDLLMPVMDGYALCRQWKAEPRLANIPFVVYTATYTDPRDKELALNLGADAFILKPAEPDAFLERIQAILSAKRTVAVSPAHQPAAGEVVLLRESNETPIRKLEDKLAQIEAANVPIRGSEQNLHNVLDGLGPSLFVGLLTPEGILLYANQPALGAANLEPEDVLPKSFDQTYWWSYSERVQEQLRSAIRQAAAGTPCRYDVQVRVAPESLIWIDFSLHPLRDDSGEVQNLLAITRDVTEHALSAQRSVEEFRILELIARAAPLADVLDALCRSVERQCEQGASCSILLLDADGVHLRHGAAPSLPKRTVRAIDGTAIGPSAGSSGTAAYLGKQVIVTDIANDPLWRDSREVALRDGLRACWSIPVFSDSGKVLATFAIYYRYVRAPTEAELRLIERAASLASIRITREKNERALRESEAQYRGLIEQASDGIFVSDAQGNLLLANSRWCELLGYEKDQITGINAKQTYLEEEREVHAKRLEHVRAGQTLRFERIVKRRDGSTFPAEISLKMLDNGCVQGIFHDITERREQESKIARLSRIQAVLSGINSAIARMRDRQELFTEACRIAVEHGRFNIAWIAVLDHANGKLMPVAQAGLSVDFDAGGSASDRSLGLVPAGTAEVALREKRPAYDNDIESTLGEFSAEFGADSMRVRRVAIGMGAKSVIVLPLFVERQTFGVVTLYAPERNFFDDAEVKLLTALAGDISFGLEFIAKEEKVDYLAYYDALSGLPNRSLFFDRLIHQLGSAARGGLNVALVIMDIDRFRLVNDTLGRQAGDALIGTVAQRIKDTFRDQDAVARVGANSFAVALSGTWQAADAARVLKSHTHQLFGQPFLLGKEELRMSASAGVAVFPGDGDSPEALFGNAEAALKKAKAGGERLLFYSPGMNARVADSLRLENKLRRALDNGELVLWYQPKVSVRTREILGFEALMRWRDPESTLMVPPAQFIPLMEQTGLILDAGSWAMSQVARDCRTWSASGMKLPRVAVNVSPIQLRQKDFVATVIEAAHKTEEAGSMLDLEITESVIMDNVEAIIPLLQSVRNLGVEIAVDDFGTGYSSLAYIARLPIQDLKIDRSFVVGMTQSEDSLSIVRSVVSLAHSLRLNVVAEGVETEEQAALLLQLGCDQMQGYLVSRPVAPDQVPALLSLDNGLGRK